jgi:hypothetical protein
MACQVSGQQPEKVVDRRLTLPSRRPNRVTTSLSKPPLTGPLRGLQRSKSPNVWSEP